MSPLQNAFGDLALDATVQIVADTVKVEDTASAGAESGVTILGVRNDAAVAKTSTDGDYSAIATDAAGRVGIADLGGSITVDGSVAVSNPGLTDAELRATPVDVTDAALATTNTNTGTTATNTGTTAGAVKLEDAIAASGDAGIPALARRNDAAAVRTDADGDYTHIATDSAGRVGISDLGGSITVDGTVTTANSNVSPWQSNAQITVTTTATAFPSIVPVIGVILMPASTNTAPIWIGLATVTSANGLRLEPGQPAVIPASVWSGLQHISTITGQNLSYAVI